MSSINNLVPTMDGSEWFSWSPRPVISPVFERKVIGKEPVLQILSAGKFENYGKWMCKNLAISGGDTYKFNVEYKPDNVSDEKVSIHAMLTWMSDDETPITRDYLNKASCLDDGWKSLYRVIDAPENATRLLVELVFKWSEGGSVTWRNPLLIKTEPVAHRMVKIASAFTQLPGTPEGNLNAILDVIDKAGRDNPDVICLTETIYSTYLGNLPLDERCIPIPGDITRAISEKARKYNSYIIMSLNEKEGDFYYNTGLLIDRKGEIAGKYRKMQLPLCEGEEGVTPGREYPVFDTDFGRIGIMICWDHGFPEVARILSNKGAEILFLPTLMYTDIQAPSRAVENGVYVVVAGSRWWPKPCRIINPEGAIISEAMGGEYNEDGVCTAVIDLDKRYYTFWLSVGAALGEGKTCYMMERRTDTYAPILE